MGGGDDNTMQSVQKAFFEYIDFISVPSPLRFDFAGGLQARSGKKIAPQELAASADAVLKKLNAPDMPEIAAFEMLNTDWVAEKGEFWTFGKQWQNGFTEVKNACLQNGVGFGLRFNAAGNKKLAKKIKKAGNGFVNEEAEELCLASARYSAAVL